MTHDPHRAEAARRRVLDPYLNRLREWNHRIPGITGDRPATVLIGKRRLSVDPRERAVIEHWAPDREAPSADSRLVMDSLSLMIKLLTEMEQVGSAPAAEARIDAEIVLSVALGEAILKQLEPLSGKHGESLWSGLKSRIEEVLAQGRDQLDGAGELRIRALAATFEVHTPPRKPAPVEPRIEPLRSNYSRPLADELDAEQAATLAMLMDRDEPEDLDLPAELQTLVEPPPLLSSRTRAALLLCVCSALLWGLVVRLPGALHQDLVSVDLSTVEALDWVEQATVRPASLYVDANAASWTKLSHGERWQAMKQLVERVSHTAARGVLVRGENEQVLAQWVEGRGVVLNGAPSGEPAQITKTKFQRPDRVGQAVAIPDP